MHVDTVGASGGGEGVEELGFELSRLEIDPSRVDDLFGPDWDVKWLAFFPVCKVGSRLAYSPVCKKWLVNIPPPAEVASVQHATCRFCCAS